MHPTTVVALVTSIVAPAPQELPNPQHQVLLLGTFHFADPGLDEFKPQVAVDVMSAPRQAELEEVLAVLARFRPTKIAVEAMPELQAELDENYARYLYGEFELPANEIHQIGFRLAEQLGHDRVHAIDAKGRWYQPYVNPEEYAHAHGQDALIDSPWYASYRTASENEDLLKAQRTIGETLFALNDPERIRKSHGIYLIGTFKAGSGSEFPGADVKTAWFNRNLRIFANIQRITEAESERILVVIGAGHLPILRHCVQCSPEYELVEPASLVEPQEEAVPKVDVAALVRAHTYELEHDDSLGGAGLDLLLSETANAQFVLLGEPHNVEQVNLFAGLLLQILCDQRGFGHLVTEQGPAIMERFTATGVRGDLEAIRTLAARHPDALHFGTDGELRLLAEAGRFSEAASPIWGVDRVLDATLGLEALLEATTAESDRELIQPVLDEARRFALDGSPKASFISSPSPAFDSLLKRLRPAADSPAFELLHALRVSREDLRAYQVAHPSAEPWGYRANERREELMKTQFLAHYRRAVAAGEVRPRSVAKLGHWHIVRGHNPGNVPSLGNFLAELARFNGMDSLSINIQPVNEPGRHWSITDYPDYDLFDAVADPARWKLVDLRPLRGYVHAGSIEVSENVGDLIFGFDLLLLLGGTDRGQITWRQ